MQGPDLTVGSEDEMTRPTVNVPDPPAVNVPPPIRVQRRPRAQNRLLQLSSSSELDISDEEVIDSEEEDGGVENPNGVKHWYRDSTWSRGSFTYHPPPREFLGISRPSRTYARDPSPMALFDLF
jgi:hypothetical protein